MTLGHHLCIRLANDAVIASTPQQRRALARVVLEQGRQADLLAFGLADNHLHIATASDRARAGKVAHAVEVSLKHRLAPGASFLTSFIKPIDEAHHLYATFRYVLRQRARHDLEGDPLREACSLPDLLGLRTLGGYTRLGVRRLLPRIRRPDLLELLGVPELAPSDGPLEHVVEATLAASALPALVGSSHEVLSARRALVEVACDRTPTRALAALSGVSRRTLFRLKLTRADQDLVAAVRLQLGLLGQLQGEAAPAEAAFVSR